MKKSPPKKIAPPTRHLVSINDLSDGEIKNICELAQTYLKELSNKENPHRIARGIDAGSKYVLASLFYEPSTRTRLSFESAMLRLGGTFITSSDPATSSVAKGESLADSVRVIANYADVIVIRHPRDGSARLAAEYSPVPVINGGDGSHEHPTQTLCDIFTLKQKNKTLKHINVAISGDLKGSRTIHSFVYALARFGARILLMPAPGMELPKYVEARLRDEFGWEPEYDSSFEKEDPSIHAIYRTPEKSHQLSLIDVIDAVYVTRFQKERWAGNEAHYPRIDAKFLEATKYSNTSVMHPLPRVNELDASFDTDKRAVYFQQAAYGVPVRMALISLLLDLDKNKSLNKLSGGFQRTDHPIYCQPVGVGVRCINENCITRDAKESQYAANKFYVVKNAAKHTCKLRCVYCETDIEEHMVESFVFAHKKKKQYTHEIGMLLASTSGSIKDDIIFENESSAIEKGFAPCQETSELERRVKS